MPLLSTSLVPHAPTWLAASPFLRLVHMSPCSYVTGHPSKHHMFLLPAPDKHSLSSTSASFFF